MLGASQKTAPKNTMEDQGRNEVITTESVITMVLNLLKGQVDFQLSVVLDNREVNFCSKGLKPKPFGQGDYPSWAAVVSAPQPPAKPAVEGLNKKKKKKPKKK